MEIPFTHAWAAGIFQCWTNSVLQDNCARGNGNKSGGGLSARVQQCVTSCHAAGLRAEARASLVYITKSGTGECCLDAT